MPPPRASYISRTSDKGYDPVTLSDDESDSDAASVTSRSTWISSAAAAGEDTAILGLVDGLIAEDKLIDELADWKISRMGGSPSFPLTHAPPLSSSHCLSCSRPMPLLLQLYCPLPSSTVERVLYVFSCPRPSCRRQDGAVRVWRANGVWREGKVEEERREREEREREERRERAKKVDLGGLVFASSSSAPGATPASSANPFNPFATTPTSASSNPFVLPLSAAAAPAPAQARPSTAAAINPFALASTSNPFAAPAAPSSAASIASSKTASPLTQTTSSWPSSSALALPSYPAQYLTTMYEPPATSVSSWKGKGKGKERELAKAMEMGLRLDAEDHDDEMDFDDDEADGGRRAGKGAGGRMKKGAPVATGDRRKTGSAGAAGGGEWQKEGYEVQKVKGVDEVFLRFQERVAREGRQVVRYEYGAEPLPYTASSSAYRLLYPSSSSSSSDSPLGLFDPDCFPRCKSCHSPSTFEAQLMPHLVSLCPDQDWATVWVASCVGECAGGADGEGIEEGENWREERALVEWEEEAV
ncbi:programmed cell death protein-like protein [Rhodotorula toruloides]|uniref:Programmed cell death protein-like protein n=1 Tax=Rhodotorula toruloides TaxID=5286 RepID=A0A511KE96_RHOTO|nr:programmed cell death protein-like protein [Rhodotorula toruloides]